MDPNLLFAGSFGNLEDRLGMVDVQFGLSRTSNLRNKKAINKSKYACVILPVFFVRDCHICNWN